MRREIINKLHCFRTKNNPVHFFGPLNLALCKLTTHFHIILWFISTASEFPWKSCYSLNVLIGEEVLWYFVTPHKGGGCLLVLCLLEYFCQQDQQTLARSGHMYRMWTTITYFVHIGCHTIHTQDVQCQKGTCFSFFYQIFILCNFFTNLEFILVFLDSECKNSRTNEQQELLGSFHSL